MFSIRSILLFGRGLISLNPSLNFSLNFGLLRTRPSKLSFFFSSHLILLLFVFGGFINALLGTLLGAFIDCLIGSVGGGIVGSLRGGLERWWGRWSSRVWRSSTLRSCRLPSLGLWVELFKEAESR